MSLWGIPICSQTSYTKCTSTKLLPCSTITSSADPPLLSQSPHIRQLLPCHMFVLPPSSPPPFFATCSLANPKSNEQSWEIPQTQLSVQLLCMTLTALDMCIASLVGFLTFSVAYCHLASCVHTTSQAKIVCSGINFCGSGARPHK